jgi:DNA-binding NtrC family response regulator
VAEKIVVVDDQEFVREGLNATLSMAGYNVVTCESGQEALVALSEGNASVLITDLRMPEMSGLELMEKALRMDEALPVIMVTAFATVENAVEAMKKGAYDYVMKPFNADAIEVVVAKAIAHRRLVAENEYLKGELKQKFSNDNFIGQSAAMKQVFSQISSIAASNSTVLIRGESGTGKELVAGAIHMQSARSARPFVRVNCAALSAGLLESELFGHEKGAFTGAESKRTGRFELAEGGTLLLDEVSEMDLSLQGKLLRVLQEKEYERVGSSETVNTDVRVLATSNRKLEDSIKSGEFREDLFYRLNVVPVELPPLRERKDDIAPLVEYFIRKHGANGQVKVTGISDDALGVLKSYDWPGNVRELENIIERAIVLGGEAIIKPENIASGISKTTGVVASVLSSQGFEVKPLIDIEKDYVKRVLDYFDGHRQKTANALDISERSLRDRLKRWSKE